MRLTAIVLAAGSGQRFGAAKQLASFEGSTLVSRAVRAAESVCAERTVLVVGNEWERVAGAAAPLAGFLVFNEQHARGIGASIAAAVGAVREASDAVLLMLGDTPLIGTDELNAIVSAHLESRTKIVSSKFGDALGPPCIFPAEFFDELAALDGDTGARRILSRHSDRVVTVACEAAGVDIDSPADLRELRGESS